MKKLFSNIPLNGYLLKQDGQTLNAFCEGFKNGDVEKIELQLNTYLRKTISIRDTFVKKQRKENFYHGILLGLLAYKENWDVTWFIIGPAVRPDHYISKIELQQ